MNANTVARLNREFVEMVSSHEGIDKFAAKSQDVISTRIHEDSFAEKIIPSKPITVGECYVDRTSDVIYKQEEIEEEAIAFIMDMNAQPTGQFIQGERFIVPFFAIRTPRYWKTAQEIRVYQHPITEYIEKNGSAEIIRQKDQYFIDLCNAAIVASANTVNSLAAGPVPAREDFINLFNLLDGNELESKKLLMAKTTFNQLLAWGSDELDIKAGETAVSGWTSATLMGREVIVTVKDGLLDDGQILAFTDPEYIGKHYVLEDLKFEMEKRFDTIQFQVSLEMGMNFGNINGVAELIIT